MITRVRDLGTRRRNSGPALSQPRDFIRLGNMAFSLPRQLSGVGGRGRGQAVGRTKGAEGMLPTADITLLLQDRGESLSLHTAARAHRAWDFSTDTALESLQPSYKYWQRPQEKPASSKAELQLVPLPPLHHSHSSSSCSNRCGGCPGPGRSLRSSSRCLPSPGRSWQPGLCGCTEENGDPVRPGVFAAALAGVLAKTLPCTELPASLQRATATIPEHETRPAPGEPGAKP